MSLPPRAKLPSTQHYDTSEQQPLLAGVSTLVGKEDLPGHVWKVCEAERLMEGWVVVEGERFRRHPTEDITKM